MRHGQAARDNRTREIRRVLLITLVANAAVVIAKVTAGLAANSLSVLADAAHSSVDAWNNIMALAEATHRPSLLAVASLASRLTAALAGRTLTGSQASQLSAAILEVLHSAGTSARGLRQSISRAVKVLASAGVSAKTAQTVSSSLADLGKEVRGPEDIGVPL